MALAGCCHRVHEYDDDVDDDDDADDDNDDDDYYYLVCEHEPGSCGDDGLWQSVSTEFSQ